METADMECLLKINPQCEVCKVKVMQVIRGTCGVYSATLDAESGTVRVQGEVNPGHLLTVLGRCGKHAEVAWVQFKGRRDPSVVYNNGYGYGSQQPYLTDHHCYGTAATTTTTTVAPSYAYCSSAGDGCIIM